MKIQTRCGCLTMFSAIVKYTKRGYAYVICPACACCVGLNMMKGDKGIKIRAFTGYNTDEIMEDLK